MCDDKNLSTKNIKTIHTYKTVYNADSVEWCPHEPFQNIFACANYQLKETLDKNERFGRILLFSTKNEQLKLLQTVETAAILDQKWCHNQINGLSLMGAVTAQKSLEIYRLNPELVQLELVTSYKLDDEEKETLILSLDWSTGKYRSDEPQIVCSDSKGNVHMFRLVNNELIKEKSWHGHEFEAWITTFYYWDPNVFFSGGDDCRFLKFDKRAPGPIFFNKNHEAGVTSMHSNKNKEYILATGSYDSNVRLWDIRHMKNCMNSIPTPGTLWRLKWGPLWANNNYLLAACMLGGVHIINSSNLQIVDSYYEHKNIAYGADWSFLPSPRSIIATCSFYDNLLCVSEVELLE